MRFRPANIRVINRRNSRLDRDSRCLPKEKDKTVDRSYHISTHLAGERANQHLFGGNCEAWAGKFLGCFVDFRSGRSSI